MEPFYEPWKGSERMTERQRESYMHNYGGGEYRNGKNRGEPLPLSKEQIGIWEKGHPRKRERLRYSLWTLKCTTGTCDT